MEIRREERRGERREERWEGWGRRRGRRGMGGGSFVLTGPRVDGVGHARRPVARRVASIIGGGAGGRIRSREGARARSARTPFTRRYVGTPASSV
ncbi:hypothetical protein GCM10023085_56480 [Actinomadura viridis]